MDHFLLHSRYRDRQGFPIIGREQQADYVCCVEFIQAVEPVYKRANQEGHETETRIEGNHHEVLEHHHFKREPVK